MKKVYLSIFLIFFPLTLFAASASVQLSNLLAGIKTMTANFSQITYAGGGLSQKSMGTMALFRPGKFRWSIRSPFKQLIVASGGYVWIYNVDLKQVTQQRFNPNKVNSPAALLSSHIKDLQKQYIVKRIKSSHGIIAFELQPKTKQALFQWVKLYFYKDELRKMGLKDNLGQRSVFQFTNIRVNQKLNPNLFRFKAPRGVDVIRG